MSLLRFLFRLPFLVIRAIYWVMGQFFWVITTLLIPLIGRMNWQPPIWFKPIGNAFTATENWVARHTKSLTIATLLLASLGYAGFYAYHWQLNRPQPIEVAPISYTYHTAKLIAPKMTNYNNAQPKPNNLTLAFNGSAAPLGNLDKDIETGIQLTPEMKGKWRWVSESRIQFTPEQDWALGQTYNVVIQPEQLLAPQSKLEQTEYQFTTNEFSYRIANAEFYQNPQDPSQKNAIFQLKFGYPVDPLTLEKQISVKLHTPSAPGSKTTVTKALQYVIQYNDKKMDAWIRSESVGLPDENGFIELTVSPGVASSLGGKSTVNSQKRNVNVPGLLRNLLEDMSITLVDGDNNSQQQVLLIKLSDAVDIHQFSKGVKAWILPKDKPKTEFDEAILNYSWDSNEDIEAEIFRASTPLKLTLGDAESDNQSLISFKFKAQPGQFIYVEVNKNYSTVGGYKPKYVIYKVLTVPDYPKMLSFMSQGSILSMKGEHKLSVVARNLNGIQLDIKRVIPSQLQHLISLNRSGDFASMRFHRLSDEHFTEHFTYQKALRNAEPGEVVYEGIDLSDYLMDHEEGRRGVFLVNLSNWQPKDDITCDDPPCADEEEYDDDDYYDDEEYRDSRLIVVTDLGIIAKRSLDGSNDLFIQSIQSGEPVASAKVSVVGKNGVAIMEGLTDETGHIYFDNFDSFKNEKTPALYIVEKEGDLSFLPIAGYTYYERRLDFSRFDTGGVENARDPGTLTGYLFSDRGIYRPGDTANLGVIVRAADWDISVKGIPLEIEVYDPRDELFEKSLLSIDENGFTEFSFTTTEASPTGSWPIYLFIAGSETKERIYIGSTVVNVKEFEPDRMKVEVKLSPETKQGWVKPWDLRARVQVDNLFGSPAQDRRVESQLKLRPMNFYFSQYADYRFYDAKANHERFEIELESRTTDETGAVELDLRLQETEKASYQLLLLTEAFEAGSGRSVAATAQTLVSPNDYLVGAKTDGDLDYIQKDSARNLTLIAINPQLEQIDIEGLTLKIFERKYLSVLTMQPSGVYKYQSKLKQELISETPLTIAKQGQHFAIATQTPGDYELMILDKDGQTVLYHTHYMIAGDANITRSLERNSELKLKLSKQEYAPDEEVELSISAPYVGSGLITIERDKVYHWQWFTTETTHSVQTIKIPQDFIGNGYINVQFVRDPNSDEIFMSPLSYGVLPFRVTLDSHRASIDLATPEVIRPGDDLPITVTTHSPQKVVVFAIDEGILQVARYRLTDPLNYFFRKRQLEVSSAQILDLILPEFSKLMALTSAPGGGDAEELDLHLNPFKRKREAPVTYWSGIIEVNGQQTLTYPVPDYFNGKLRVMAVSVNPERIGTAQTYTTVRDDLVLTPNIPFMAAPGDEFEVTLGVANNMTDLNGESVPVSVTLKTTPHLQLISEPEQHISLAEKREGMVRFRLKATEQLGGAELIFTAAYTTQDKQHTSVERFGSTSVRPVMPYRTVTEMGRMAGKQQEVNSMRAMFNPYAKREARVSFSPLVLTNGLASYLENYPHYCSEQLVSRAIPQLMQTKYADVMGVSAPVAENDPLAGLFTVLRSRQNSQGAIGLWRATATGDSFVTLYVAHYLLEAKEHGVAVPADLLSKVNLYLQRFAADNSINSENGFMQRAYAVYLLTRQGEVTTNLLSTVQERLQNRYPNSWQNNTATVLYLASTYQMLQMDKQADEMLKPVWKQLEKAYDNAWWSHNYHDPLVQNSTAIYLISRHFPQKAKAIPAQALENMALMLRNNRHTTLSSAMTILALDSYVAQLQKLNEQQGDEDELLMIKAKKAESMRLISQLKGPVATAKFSQDDQQIIFDNLTTFPAWYSVVQGGFDRLPPEQAVSRGLEIIRNYTDEQGKPVNEVKLGEKVNVVIKVRANSKAAISNIAIVDLLPGGFEVVQQTPTFQSDDEHTQAEWTSPVAYAGSNWDIEYSDIREDRVIIYGSADASVKTFVYQIKATNVGTYLIPAAYGEAMYDRDIQAVSAAQGQMIVTPVN